MSIILNNSSSLFANFHEKKQIYNNLDDIINPKHTSNGPNSRPLLIYQHATISDTFFPLSLPSNVSFTLLEGWSSKNVTINYDGISHYKDWVKNGTFPTGKAPWEYFRNNINFLEEPWQTIDEEKCVGIKIENGKSFAKGDYGYFEENLTIPEGLASNSIATLSMDYYYSLSVGGTELEDAVAYISIDIGGISKNTSISYINLVEDSWTAMSINYDLNTVGQNLPENVTIRAGIFADNETSNTGSKDHFLYIDNIQFTVWTNPNQPNLIFAKDIEFNKDYPCENITFGKGKTFIDVERNRTETSDIKFSISKNPSHTEELEIYNITITSEAVKVFNSTMNGQEGSIYTTNNQINWQTELSFSIPYSYLNNWAEIKKPSDWNITSVLDGYNVEKKGSCTGIGLGSESMKISQGVLNLGLWKIKASSQNYISHGGLIVWNGTTYIEQSNLTLGDMFQINTTLNNIVTYENTHVNCTIEYPNGTIFWKGNKEASSYNVKFGSFTVGKNMSIGIYKVILLWSNNHSYLYRDKIGYSQFNFKVWHHTNLTAVDSNMERISGEPLLIKVNFTDYESNTYIDFATVTYNSTIPGGSSGSMAYLGSGIYGADVDISGVEEGIYYFSFNASKDYFENQSVRNLIQLTIISQHLALEIANPIINADANSYAICRVNVTGALTGTPIPGDINISTDWLKSYTNKKIKNGTYELNFSTYDLPTQGIIETFEVTIFANKTNYGNTSAYISITVNPIPTVANVNASIVDIYYDKNFSLEVSYVVEGSGEIITGATLNITWSSSYNINQTANGFIIEFSTEGLALNVYTLLIQLDHPGYETAFKSVYVNVIPKSTALKIYLNHIDKTSIGSITLLWNQPLNITVFYVDSIANNYISNATVEVNGSKISEASYQNISQYSIIYNSSELSVGIHFITVKAQKENYNTFSSVLQITVDPIPTVVNVNESIIDVYYGMNFFLEVNYVVEGSNETITEATLNILWASLYNYSQTANGFIIDFSTEGLSLDVYTLIIQLDHPGYEAAFKSVYVNVLSKITTLEIFLNQINKNSDKSISISWNEPLNITILYKDSIADNYISNATVEVNGSKISEISYQNTPHYTINFNPGELPIGIHFLTVTAQKKNYDTISSVLKIIVEQIEINVEPIDFTDSLDVFAGKSIDIRIRLFEYNTGNIIQNANVTYSWQFNSGEFQYIGNGTYETNLNVRKDAKGSYTMTLTVFIDGRIYKTTDFSFVIVVSQEPTPNYMIWIIIPLLCVTGVFSALILRTYVIIPKKKKKEKIFMNTIQVFKDLKNIHGIMLIQKKSGLPIFMKNVSGFDLEDNFLISGFIQAITLFGEQAIINGTQKEKKTKDKEIYADHIIDLNFKYFHLLICDFGSLRSLLVLKDKSSEKLKLQLYLFTIEIDRKFSEKIEKFIGKNVEFKNEIDALLNQFFNLHYNEPFKLIIDKKYMQVLKKSRELKPIENRILNIIKSLTKLNKEFTLNRIIEEMDEKNIDLIYGGLHTLIKRKIIIPSYFKDEDSHPLIGGLKES